MDSSPQRPSAPDRNPPEEGMIFVGGPPPHPSRPGASDATSAHPILYPGLTWLLGLLVGVMLLRFFVPYFAEQIQYAMVRGEERAKYDVAGEHLQNTSLDELSLAYQMVSKRVAPSVVNIRTLRQEATPDTDEFRQLFGRVPPQEMRGQGSGVVVDADGFLLTNYHVVHGANQIEVQLSDGRNLPAKVIGVDAPTDLAVLKVEATGLTPVEWGDSDKTEVGSLVWAVGSPFGLDRSITSGILSAKNRSGIARSAYQDFLQTDAAVNPGNSGGPLVDVHGRLIGINTAIIGDSFQGISFALPSSIAMDVYTKLKRDRRVARGWLGVGLDDVTDARAKALGMPEATGVFVPQVIEDANGPSPAQRAGIVAGDVILTWDGHEIDSPVTLSRLVAKTDIGATVVVTLWRDGRTLSKSVTVGERPLQLN